MSNSTVTTVLQEEEAFYESKNGQVTTIIFWEKSCIIFYEKWPSKTVKSVKTIIALSLSLSPRKLIKILIYAQGDRSPVLDNNVDRNLKNGKSERERCCHFNPEKLSSFLQKNQKIPLPYDPSIKQSFCLDRMVLEYSGITIFYFQKNDAVPFLIN